MISMKIMIINIIEEIYVEENEEIMKESNQYHIEKLIE